MLLEHRGDTLYGGRWDHEHTATRPEHSHPECAAFGVERQSALGGPPHGDPEVETGVDLAAAHAAPRPAGPGHHSERGRRRALLGADDEHHRSGGYGWRSEARRSNVGAADPQQRNVGRRIAPDPIGGDGLATGQDDRDLAFVSQGLLGGDDQAGPPYETARARPPGVNG